MSVILREGLPPLPKRMRGLPLDHRGFPVPWFVAFIDGAADFRVIRTNGISIAHNKKTCWLCGQPLGVHLSFVIGPMCTITRTISEPPSHLDCATFAATACPFLTKPRMKRNETDLPGHHAPAGVGLKRNPGAACVWTTRRYKPFRVANGVLFELGEPERVDWYCEGRAATRAEVQASIDSGLPFLMEPAQAEGRGAVAALRRSIALAQPLLPSEARP